MVVWTPTAVGTVGPRLTPFEEHWGIQERLSELALGTFCLLGFGLATKPIPYMTKHFRIAGVRDPFRSNWIASVPAVRAGDTALEGAGMHLYLFFSSLMISFARSWKKV